MNLDLEKNVSRAPETPLPIPSLATNQTQNPAPPSSPVIELIDILSKKVDETQDDDILRRLKTLVAPRLGETPPSIHSDSETVALDNAAKLVRILRAFAYPTEQISFKGFTLLNIFSILLYEHELLAFHIDFTTNPESLLCPEKVSKMRNLLKEYSKSPCYGSHILISALDSALSAYKTLQGFEPASPDKFGIHNQFQWLASKLFPQDAQRTERDSEPVKHHNLCQWLASKLFPQDAKQTERNPRPVKYPRYDDIVIDAETPDSLREFLSTRLPDSLVYTASEREWVGVMRTTFKGKEQYGRGIVIDHAARIVFGLYGAVALLIPLVVLNFIQSVNYRILAATMFVLVFSLQLAILSNASNQELVTATAGYAAVLVVFIGSSTVS
jgi:hypothetical protein